MQLCSSVLTLQGKDDKNDFLNLKTQTEMTKN